MRGLWIKDLIVMKKQLLALIITYVLAIFSLIFFKTNGIYIGMLIFSLTFAFITSNSLTYDQQNHGLKYLFSLPIKRKQFVTEKYVLLSATIVIAIILMTITAAIVLPLLNTTVTFLNIFTLTYETGGLVYLFITIILQYQIKHGPEKTQQFMSILGAFVAIIIGGILTLIKYSVNARSLFNNIYSFLIKSGNITFLIILTLIIGILISSSYLISAKNLESANL